MMTAGDGIRRSNEAARGTWEVKAVGSQRSAREPGSSEYFAEIRAYRHGYETPWIPRIFDFAGLRGKRVLEIGVGHGIDGVEMARHGAIYSGIDITRNHLGLTRRNFELNGLQATLHEGDLLSTPVAGPFDVVYSFGVLHHIEHEEDYLKRIRELLAEDGRLMIALYSKVSFFNAYLVATWFFRGRRHSLTDWQSHLAEGSKLGSPVTIKIRTRAEIAAMLAQAGFTIERYHKLGFVQNYLPGIGRRLKPDGATLRFLGRILGWYHVMICRASKA